MARARCPKRGGQRCRGEIQGAPFWSQPLPQTRGDGIIDEGCPRRMTERKALNFILRRWTRDKGRGDVANIPWNTHVDIGRYGAVLVSWVMS